MLDNGQTETKLPVKEQFQEAGIMTAISTCKTLYDIDKYFMYIFR